MLKIHECSELPSLANLELDADCVDRMASVYDALKLRGSGQYGFAMEIITAYGNPPKNETLIVKISTINTNELRVACELNSIMSETPIFPHAYGWLICSKVPDDWLSLLRIRARHHMILTNPPSSFMFTFIQPVKETWDDATLPANHGYRVTLFFLLHGLYVTRRKIGFNHGDIHAGNIMLEYHLKETISILRYNHYEAEVRSRYVPRLIDYGRSSTSRHTDNEGASDLKQLRKTFDERLDYDMDNDQLGANEEAIAFNQFVASVKWRQAEEVYGKHGNADLILPMLEHSYFDVPEIQRQQVKRQAIEPIQRCFSCCTTNPRHQINHQVAAPKYFCSDWCYGKIHAICRFIK